MKTSLTCKSLLSRPFSRSHFKKRSSSAIVSLAKQDQEPEVDLVAAQYEGKENLKPIYEGLLQVIKSFGDDITITPKKGSVSIIRKRQFLLIKPATKTRIDLGFKLKDYPVGERLGNSGPFGTMCTHRVQLSDAEQIDAELIQWMQEAYQRSV